MSGFSAAVSVHVCERMRVCGRMRVCERMRVCGRTCVVYPCVDVS